MRHHAHVSGGHLALYGVLAALVVAAGGLAIWSFVERQTLAVEAEPLPKVTVVAQDPHAPLAAAWVNLLTRAGAQATLVSVESCSAPAGVVLFCDVRSVPPACARGDALAFAGVPGALGLSAERGTSDTAMRWVEASSPLLARLMRGYQVQTRRATVALLQESPRMVIDARWRDNARAAVMHMEGGGKRVLWFGFDPDALVAAEDRQLILMLRTALRWVDGQPISDGGTGAAERGFAFSADRLSRRDELRVRMVDRSPKPIATPEVKIWLPPGATHVALAGDFLMRRGATLRTLPDESACVVSLQRLAPGEERTLKVRADYPSGPK